MRPKVCAPVIAAVAIAALAGCATSPPPAIAPPPSPPTPTDIVMDAGDDLAVQGALRQVSTKAVDEVVGWANPDSGKRGAVKVLRDGFDRQNRPCREYHSIVLLADLARHSTGFLCRQTDGTWSVADRRDYPIVRRDAAS